MFAFLSFYDIVYTESMFAFTEKEDLYEFTGLKFQTAGNT